MNPFFFILNTLTDLPVMFFRPFYLYLFFFLSTLVACRQSSEATEDSKLPSSAIKINKPFWRLRTAPGSLGKVIRELEPGEVIQDLGEVTDYFTPLTIQDKTYHEPWLKVQTQKGEIGWIYGAVLNFEQTGSQAQAQVLQEKRFQSLFGAAHARSMRTYVESWGQVRTAQQLARVYRRGHAFCDSLSHILETKVQVGDAAPSTDLFWLGQMTPGFIPQLVAEGTTYHLFADYRKFWQKARATSSKEDDAFLGLCVTLFPEDSIEYFFPAYFLQTTDYGGSSLLGRGIHRQVLTTADSLLIHAPLFSAELKAIRDGVINDITNAKTTYWEQADKILAELIEIVRLDLAILSKADNIALKSRLEQFKQPAKYGIKVNVQSGREE